MAFTNWIVPTFSLIYFTISIGSGEKPSAKITDGWPTDITQEPFAIMVMLTWWDFFASRYRLVKCSASILDSQWVLTSGHCIQGLKRYTTGPTYFVMGVEDSLDFENMPRKNGTYPEGLPRADLTICHPDYFKKHYKYKRLDHWQTFHDLCLLRVDHDLQFGTYINRVTLPWTAYDQHIQNKEFLISGFGATSYPFSKNHHLFSTRLKLLPSEDCVERFSADGFLVAFDLCTISAHKPTSGTCGGDSGSALVSRDNITDCPVIIGVDTSGEFGRCGVPNRSTKFMNVMAYRSWIQQTIERYTRPKGTVHEYKYPLRNEASDD